MVGMDVFAHSFQKENADGVTIYYNFINNGSALEVTFCGRYSYSYDNEYFGVVVIPKEVVTSKSSYNVKSIGNEAFEGCTGLTSITIPNSVTSIGWSAFRGCSGLTSISIPNSVTSIGNDAFDGTAWYDNQPDGVVYAGKNVYKYKGTMPQNTSIVINEGTYSISPYAFMDCSRLTSITIPNSVTSISQSTFAECSGLTSMTIPNSVTRIGDSAFEGCTGLTSITIPNSVTSIGGYAFRDCSSLTSVTIPNTVTSIGWCSAFEGCSSLTSIIIPNSVTSISRSTFYGCSSLTSITIPNSVTRIGDEAFRGCSGLTSVTIPNSVTFIGNSAFSGCSGLTSIAIPNSVTSMGDSAFDGTAWYDNQPDGVVYAGKNVYKYKGTMPNNTTIVINEGTYSITDGAFSDCSGLVSITIPNSVTSIGSEVFARCSCLTSVTIPNSVTIIGDKAFEECSGLTSVTIPNSVTIIGYYAFLGCTGLKDVYCYAEQVPTKITSRERIFYNSNYKNATLHVPAGSIEAYRNADEWKDFKNIVALTDNDPKPTDISSVVNSTSEIDGTVYDLNGRRMATPQRGLNIIRMKDGTTRKVMKK